MPSSTKAIRKLLRNLRMAFVASPTQGAGDTTLEVDLGPLAEGTRLGDSICTSGACLTVAALTGSLARFDVSTESQRCTTIPGWQAGRLVNLERALKLGDRLGGHLVGGHVDGVGRLVDRRRDGDSERFTFVIPDDGSVQVVEKGSVAVDGISLTTWDCRGARFSVALIPHTLAQTTLVHLRPGMPVNLEMDVIGRWVGKLVGADPSRRGS
jgi:riboflavin synthase